MRSGTPQALLSAALGVLVCSACEGTKDTPDAGASVPADSGPLDASGEPDTGVVPMDASAPDTGVNTCDPIANSGCMDPKVCVFNSNVNQTQCRTIPGTPVGHELPCNATTLNCEAGLTCIQLQGDTAPVCRAVCDDRMAGACANVTGSSPNYSCQGLMSMGSALLYGVCQGQGMRCVPYADTCPMDQVCALRARNTYCAPQGPVARGGDCTDMQCRKGSVCVFLNGTAHSTCYEPCDPMGGACTTGSCQQLQNLSFGVCM